MLLPASITSSTTYLMNDLFIIGKTLSTWFSRLVETEIQNQELGKQPCKLVL